ncbi:uncharacterized protein A4U43_C06F11340 [Asparagus officinalis]|uniref:Uncharacterized protein n=1 Tax=Asparagus officinalis TaxID=4686 RepID=A0A5P1EL51_ASPOF|nr:uncharacterized protein A4U43_C06F11340 [Asparagus officinalis]
MQGFEARRPRSLISYSSSSSSSNSSEKAGDNLVAVLATSSPADTSRSSRRGLLWRNPLSFLPFRYRNNAPAISDLRSLANALVQLPTSLKYKLLGHRVKEDDNCYKLRFPETIRRMFARIKTNGVFMGVIKNQLRRRRLELFLTLESVPSMSLNVPVSNRRRNPPGEHAHKLTKSIYIDMDELSSDEEKKFGVNDDSVGGSTNIKSKLHAIRGRGRGTVVRGRGTAVRGKSIAVRGRGKGMHLTSTTTWSTPHPSTPPCSSQPSATWSPPQPPSHNSPLSQEEQAQQQASQSTQASGSGAFGNVRLVLNFVVLYMIM